MSKLGVECVYSLRQLLDFIRYSAACHASLQPLVRAKVDAAIQVNSGMLVTLHRTVNLPKVCGFTAAVSPCDCFVVLLLMIVVDVVVVVVVDLRC